MFCELLLDLVSELGVGSFLGLVCQGFGLAGLVLWVGVAWFAGLLRVRFAGACWFWWGFGNLVCGALVFGWWLCSGLSGDCWLHCN